MSLPPALLQRLAQRGLVQKQKELAKPAAAENEEVIAEDYDEMETSAGPGVVEEEYQSPPLYDNDHTLNKRPDENFWLERMKARMGEASSAAGFKGCPNKYNIWHKCTLYCVNRWAEGREQPSREYKRRYKRMLRKYPLPKGWVAIYDPGCGCYYFANETDGVVSWLSPTHPKSQIGKSAALMRRQLEDSTGEGAGSETEEESEEESGEDSRSSPPAVLSAQDFPSLHESVHAAGPLRKQKSRDLERHMSRQRRDRERDHERDRQHGRRSKRDDTDVVDPMDPSAYSDTPRGKWSDGLHAGNEENKKPKDDGGKTERRGRRDNHSDDDERDY